MLAHWGLFEETLAPNVDLSRGLVSGAIVYPDVVDSVLSR